MGACGSSEEEVPTKILLLGTTGAGKSTVVRNLTILSGERFPEEIKAEAARKVVGALLVALAQIYAKMQSRVSPENKKLGEHVTKVLFVLKEGFTNVDRQTEELVFTAAVKIMKSSEGAELFATVTQELIKELQLPETLETFLVKPIFERISKNNFEKLTDQEMLSYRESTRGSSSHMFRVADGDQQLMSCTSDECKHTATQLLEMVDVGGHIIEQTYWNMHYQDTTALLFVVALDDYHKLTPKRSDGKIDKNQKNRMTNSLSCFSEVCGDKRIGSLPIVVLFNKMDELDRKIRSGAKMYKLRKHFKRFPSTEKKKQKKVDEAKDWIKQQFNDVFSSSGRANKQISRYETCAIDTEMMNNVLKQIFKVVFVSKIATTNL